MKKDINLSLADDADLKPHLRDAESILSSPDLGLLKLASPELERLIIQSNGMVTTTPTSPQFLYPKTVTDEQEFAEGFVKALEDLHKQNQLNGTGQTNSSMDLGANIAPVNVQPDLPVYTNLNSYGSGPLGTTVNYSTDTVPFPPPPSTWTVRSASKPRGRGSGTGSRLLSVGGANWSGSPGWRTRSKR